MSDQDRLTHDTEVKRLAVASPWGIVSSTLYVSPIRAPAPTRVAHPYVATAGDSSGPIAAGLEVAAYWVAITRRADSAP